MRIRSEIEIAASPERVWQLTEAIEGWPEFMPTVALVERLDAGPLAVGCQARLTQPGQKPVVWTVTRYEPPRVFAWEGTSLGMKFTGTHLLEPRSAGCRNVLRLDVEGGVLVWLLAPLFRWALNQENEAFKKRAEG